MAGTQPPVNGARPPREGRGGHAGVGRPDRRSTPPARTITRPNGTRDRVTRGNRTVHYGNDGRTPTRIDHGRVRVDIGRNGTRTRYRGGRVNYRQGFINRGGTRILQRNYYRGNRTVVRNYYPHHRGNFTYYSYRSGHSRPSNYYRYYRNPWAYRIVYPWFWYRDPWYVNYRYYYHPYHYYVGPSYWLVDFYFSSILSRYYYDDIAEQDYEAEIDRAAAAQERAAAEAEFAQAEQSRADIDAYKEQLRQQVEENLSAIEADHDIDVGETLQDGDHIYTVSDEAIDTVALNGNETCTLSAGDLLRLRRDSSGRAMIPSSSATNAQMEVLTSKAESCEAGSIVAVSIEDLQNMENSFAETIDEGMEKMQSIRETNPGLVP